MADISVQILPIVNSPQFEYVATIEGISAKLVFNYNYRTKHYHLTMTLLNGTDVINGHMVVPNTPFPLVSPLFINGFRGLFSLTPIKGKVEDNEETMLNWATYYFFSYNITAAS